MNRLFAKRPKANDASPNRKNDNDEATAQLTNKLNSLNIQAQAPPVPPKSYPSIPKPPIPPFPGGFHPTLAIGDDGHRNDNRPPAFPQADQYAHPGPLPIPPAMPVPQHADPQMSNTMRYALGLQQPSPTLPRVNHLQLPLPPKLPPRPVSDPPPQTTSESISAGPRPTSKRHNAQLAVTTGPQAVANSPKSRRRSSSTASAPASPVSTRTSSSGAVQCHGMTAKGDRCKKTVKKQLPLGVLQPEIDGDELPVYCAIHSKQIQGDTHRILQGEAIAFDEYITSEVQVDTANALKLEMAKEPTPSDGPGYIYIFEIVDPTDKDKYRHFKVGRAAELNKRQNEWRRQCVGQHQAIIGWWPGHPGGGGALHGTNKPGPKGPYVAKLERLIHLELADWALNAPYLDEEGKCERKALPPREECKHCGVRHQEIFTFRRATSGQYKGKEFEEIVWKIVEKWGGYVRKYDSRG
ncbi:hypothetical protein K474DRAFT_1694225 [Panus rudis PR-1116 ss-1]|nr:hypothetical protein K474DRAFT_1694225 [Panus rudis PR-1116 ss-1]